MTKQEQQNIFLVDDDIDLLFQTKIQLEAQGFVVTTAESKSEAETLLETYRPDVAVLDLMMEEMDAGFNLSYFIKKKYPGTPVILVTAVTRETGFEFDATSEEDRAWIKVDTIIAKPVRFEQLLREIERLLKE